MFILANGNTNDKRPLSAVYIHWGAMSRGMQEMVDEPIIFLTAMGDPRTIKQTGKQC